jgi:hypothetical protein
VSVISAIRVENEEANNTLEAELREISRARAESTKRHEESLKIAKEKALIEQKREMEAHQSLLANLTEEKRAAEMALKKMKEVHKVKIKEFIKDSQELLTLEKKKVEIAGEVFKEERRRNREEVERLKSTFDLRLKEAKEHEDNVERRRKASTEGHLSALQKEKMRAAALIQIREKELEVTKKQAELMAAEMESSQGKALVMLAEEERTKRSIMLEQTEEEHAMHVEDLKREMKRLQEEKDALQREMDKCTIS